MTPEQLTIDGRAEPYPPRRPRALTERQRELLRFVRTNGTCTTAQAGQFYADASGALRRLGALGLVRRRIVGLWEPAPGRRLR